METPSKAIGPSLMVLGVCNAVTFIPASIDINSAIRYRGSSGSLWISSPIVGMSMILSGILCVTIRRSQEKIMIISTLTMMVLALVCLTLSAIISTFYYVRLPIYNLMASRSVALFALITFIHLSSFIMLAYTIIRQFRHLPTSIEQNRCQREIINASEHVDVPDNTNTTVALEIPNKRKVLLIMLCFIGALTLLAGLGDIFILQGLYSSQTNLAGIFLLLAGVCGFTYEGRRTEEAVTWSYILLRIGRLISVITIGINTTIFANICSSYLNYHSSVLAVYLLSTVFVTLGLILSSYVLYTFKLAQTNEQRKYIGTACRKVKGSPLQSVIVRAGHFQFISGLALWTVGIISMILNVFASSCAYTFYLASLLLITSRLTSATFKKQPKDIVYAYVIMLIFCMMASVMEIVYIITDYHGWSSSDAILWHSSPTLVAFMLALSVIIFIGCLVSTFEIYKHRRLICFNENTLTSICAYSRRRNLRDLLEKAHDVQELVEGDTQDVVALEIKDVRDND